MLQVPMQPVKKGDWVVIMRRHGTVNVLAAAFTMIPVEGGRELSARAIYLRKPKCLIWKRLNLR